MIDADGNGRTLRRAAGRAERQPVRHLPARTAQVRGHDQSEDEAVRVELEDDRQGAGRRDAQQARGPGQGLDGRDRDSARGRQGDGRQVHADAAAGAGRRLAHQHVPHGRARRASRSRRRAGRRRWWATSTRSTSSASSCSATRRAAVPPPAPPVAPAVAQGEVGRRQQHAGERAGRQEGARRREDRRRRGQEEVDALAPRSGERAVRRVASPRGAATRVGVRGRVAASRVPARGVRLDGDVVTRRRLRRRQRPRQLSAATSDGVRAGGAGGEAVRAVGGADGRAPLPADPAAAGAARGGAGSGAQAGEAGARAGRAPRLGDDRAGAAGARRRAAGPGRGRVSAGALRAGRAVAPHPACRALRRTARPSWPAHVRGEITEMLRTADIRRVGIGIDRSGRHDLRRRSACRRDTSSCSRRFRGSVPPGGQVSIQARIARRPRESGGRGHRARRYGARAEAAPAQGRDTRRSFAALAAGRYQVEIVASGKVGSTVLANFPALLRRRAARRRAARARASARSR